MRVRTYKVVLWGFRTEYDYFRKYFEVELLKGNMQIVAIVLNEFQLFQKVDGIDVVGMEVITSLEYDYIINMNQKASAEVARILQLLQIPQENVIPARVFSLPFFDLQRWVQVKESNISIISSHCWGGFAYNTLGLPFRSPFINMFWDNKEFLKMLEDIEEYMDKPLIKLGEAYETNLKRNYPVVGLGDLTIQFNHYTDFEEAVSIWNRRKERINYDNLFIETTAKDSEEISRFLELPYENKVCFTMLECNEKNVISIRKEQFRSRYEDREWQFALATVTKDYAECKQYDLLKLLNKEEDYMRMM